MDKTENSKPRPDGLKVSKDDKLEADTKNNRVGRKEKGEKQDSSASLQSCQEDEQAKESKNPSTQHGVLQDDGLSDENEKVDIPDYVGDRSEEESDNDMDCEDVDLLHMMEKESRFLDEDKLEVDNAKRVKTEESFSLSAEELHMAIVPAAQSNQPSALGLGCVEAPDLGVLSAHDPAEKTSVELKGKESLVAVKKRGRKKEPAVAQRQSSRIHRDGIPIQSQGLATC
ncbi:hypothetical protein ABZP36_003637 [Zizania latifolia]